MTTLVDQLNHWGGIAVPFAAQLLWQSSLLIIVLLALDLLLRNRVRAGVRYALWMLLLLKLVLPPSLAMPTGAGYWIDRAPHDPVVENEIPGPTVSTETVRPANASPVQFEEVSEADLAEFEAMIAAEEAATKAPTAFIFPTPPEPSLTFAGGLFAVWAFVAVLLFGWMLWRWRWVNGLVRTAGVAPDELQELARGVSRTIRQRAAELRITDATMSPAVCGLFRPVILLPRRLVDRLSNEQLRAVLLHELIHLRRCDLWVNCLQTAFQIAAWWHPLLWLANARIRRVREEAVDEAVASVLRDDADVYPATLLEVAKLTFARPLLTLGLVGILESKSALKQRIRRLVEMPPLESARIKWWQWTAVVSLALVALPMAQGHFPEVAKDELATKDEPSRTSSGEPGFPAELRFDLKPPNGRSYGSAIETLPTTGFKSSQNREPTVPPAQFNTIIGYEVALDGRAPWVVGNGVEHPNPSFPNLRSSSTSHGFPVNGGTGVPNVYRYLGDEARDDTIKPNPSEMTKLLLDQSRQPTTVFFYGDSWFSQVLPFAVERMKPRHDELFEQETICRLWGLDAELLEHPFMKRHIDEYDLRISAEPNTHAEENEGYMTSVLNGKLRFKHSLSPVEENAMVSKWLVAYEKEIADGTKVLKDMKAVFGEDPLADPDKIYPKEKFKTAVPIIQMSMELDRRTNFAKGVRQQLKERERASTQTTKREGAPAATQEIHSPDETKDSLGTEPRLTIAVIRDQIAVFESGKPTDVSWEEAVAKLPPGQVVEIKAAKDVSADVVSGIIDAIGKRSGKVQLTILPKGLVTDTLNPDTIRERVAANPVPGVLDQESKGERNEVQDVSTQVQNARLLLQMGRIDEAKKILIEAAMKDPGDLEVFDTLVEIRHWEQSEWAKTPEYAALAQKGAKHQAIMEKLYNVRLDEVAYDGLPLSEVVKNLTDDVRRRDTNGTGVNFLITSSVAASEPQFATDPATGAPVATHSGGNAQVDIGNANIKISKPITGFRLIDVLDAIVLASDQPIKYTVEDYAVIFSPKTPEPERLFTRTIKVNPNTFYPALERAMTNLGQQVSSSTDTTEKNPDQTAVPPANGQRSVTETNYMSAGNLAVRAYFEAAGVELKAPKMVFFNERKGILMVRASLADLEIIQQAAATLNFEPPQVTLEARIVEMPPSNGRAVLVWRPGVSSIETGDAAEGVVGSQSPPEASAVSEKKSTLERPRSMGFLNASELKVVTTALERQKRVKMWSFPRVTTLSGRQTKLTAIDSRDQATSSADSEAYGTLPSIEVTPYVSADGQAIEMTIIPTLEGAPGVHDSTVPIGTPIAPSSRDLELSGPQSSGVATGPQQPQIRQASATLAVWDGQTAVISFPPDKSATNQFVIFITPTIIDPAGNRVNDPDKVPILRDLVPPQPVSE